MTGESLDQVRNSPEPPDAPGFANHESQPLSPLMANRWVSQNASKNQKLLSKNTKYHTAFTMPDFFQKNTVDS